MQVLKMSSFLWLEFYFLFFFKERQKYFVYIYSTIFQLVFLKTWTIFKWAEESNKEGTFFLQGTQFQWQNRV